MPLSHPPTQTAAAEAAATSAEPPPPAPLSLAAAAAPPPAAAAAQPNPAALAQLLAGALQQQQAQPAPGVTQAALAAALNAALGGGSAVPPPPRAPAPAGPPLPPLPPPPAWATQLVDGWLPAAAPPPPPVAVGEAGAAAAELSTLLAAPVALPGAPPSAPGAITLPVAPDGTLTPTALDAAVAAAVSPARSRGAPRAAALAAVWSRATSQPSPLAAAVAAAAARSLATSLATDDGGGDLFFEGGAAADGVVSAAAAGTLPPAFLTAALASGGGGAAAPAGWTAALTAALARAGGGSLEDLPDAWGARLAPLDALTSPPPLAAALGATLASEAAAAPRLGGAAFEARSVLAPLLRVSPFPDVPASVPPRGVRTHTPARSVFTSARGYPDRYGEAQAVMRTLAATVGRAGHAAHAVADRTARAKAPPPLPPSAPREALLAWLAAAAGGLSSRASGGDKGALDVAALEGGASDSFALGVVSLALRFCRPFLDPSDKTLAHLDPAYYTTAAPYRLPGVDREARLDGNRPAAVDDEDGTALPSSTPRPYLSPSPGAPNAPHFIADCFFLTQRLVHVGLLPAANRFLEGWERIARAAAAGGHPPGAPPGLEEALFRDSGMAALADPAFATDACRFAVLTLVWLGRLLETGGVAALAPIPAHTLRDACGWLASTLRLGGADVVGACDVGAAVAALAALLRAQGALGPLAAAAAVDVLQAALAPQLDPRRAALGGPLGPAALSPGERALVATVLATGGSPGAALVPALMRAHAAADAVVGLDVDRDRFDKYGFRGQVDALLMELWNDGACLASTAALAAAAATAAAAAPGGADAAAAAAATDFGGYIESVLNSLIYLLEDAFVRVQAIHDVETAKADATAWASLPPPHAPPRRRTSRARFAPRAGSWAWRAPRWRCWGGWRANRASRPRWTLPPSRRAWPGPSPPPCPRWRAPAPAPWRCGPWPTRPA